MIKMAVFVFLNHSKLISRKIRSAGKLLNFHTMEYPQSKFPIRLHRSVCHVIISFFSRSHTVQAIEFAIPVSSMHAAFSSPASPPSLVASSCSSSLNVRPITSSSIQPGTWQWPSPFYFCFQNLPMIQVKTKNTPFWIQDLRLQRTCHLPRIQSLVSNIIQKVCNSEFVILEKCATLIILQAWKTAPK